MQVNNVILSTLGMILYILGNYNDDGPLPFSEFWYF